MIKLGLIGKGILKSQAPDLHCRLGKLVEQVSSYDLFDGNETGFRGLEGSLGFMREAGYQGTNITFPFKEAALSLADTIGESARKIGATNTLILGESIQAENTDYTGFMSAYRFRFGQTAPGEVLLIGGGGVGRAVAVGLVDLGAKAIYLAETDVERGRKLVEELKGFGVQASLLDATAINSTIPKVQGVVNCSPVGHMNHPGCPIDVSLLQPQQWVFDAVYVPANTEFLQGARKAGCKLLSGVDLFVFQGLDAFKFFTASLSLTDRVDLETKSLHSYYMGKLFNTV